MATKSMNVNTRIATEQAARASAGVYDDEVQYDAPLGLDDLQVRIMKAQSVADEVLKRATRFTDRMFGESACDSGGESLKSSPYGMVQVLNSQIGDLIDTLSYLDSEMRRIASL